MDHLTFEGRGGGGVEELVCARIFFFSLASVFLLQALQEMFFSNLPPLSPQRSNGPPPKNTFFSVILIFKKTVGI